MFNSIVEFRECKFKWIHVISVASNNCCMMQRSSFYREKTELQWICGHQIKTTSQHHSHFVKCAVAVARQCNWNPKTDRCQKSSTFNVVVPRTKLIRVSCVVGRLQKCDTPFCIFHFFLHELAKCGAVSVFHLICST